MDPQGLETRQRGEIIKGSARDPGGEGSVLNLELGAGFRNFPM